MSFHRSFPPRAARTAGAVPALALAAVRAGAVLLAAGLAGALGGCGAEGAPGVLPPAFADADSGPSNASFFTVSDADASPAPIAPGATGVVAPAPPAPAPDDAARAVAALKRLGAHALVELARRLETGIALDDVRRGCLGAHDPALGAPLAALDCTEPVAVADTPVTVRALALKPDEGCLATLADASRGPAAVVAACDWTSASMRLRTQWIAPPEADAHTGRPRPLTGAIFDYADAPATLVATNLPSRLDGRFTCTADLATGGLAGDTDCAAGMADFAARLEGFAAGLDAGAPN